MLYRDITELIGNTPLLRLDPGRHGIDGTEIYAKLEFFNPFGSVKDRIAWGMIRGDLGEITRHGQSLIEASSGNTAKALQVLAAMHGLRLRVLTNRAKVPEVRDMLELLGGDLEEMPGLSECPDPTVPNDVFSAIQALMARRPGEFYHTAQYTNQANVRTHHDTTGKEIADDLGAVDVLFGGLGTTGSTRGAATFLQAANPHLQTIGIVSTKEDFIPGIRSEAELWDVGLFEPAFYTEIIPVRAADAIDAALDLARHHGVLRRAEDLDPRDQQILTEIRAHCAQLDHLAGNVTSFAKMMTRRTGERDSGWLEQVEAEDQPELHTFATGIRQTSPPSPPGSACPTAPDQPKATSTGSKPSRDRCTVAPPSTCSANASSITLGKKITEFAPEPITLASDTLLMPVTALR